MPEAALKIYVIDSGTSPIGQPAPAGVSASSMPAPTPTASSAVTAPPGSNTTVTAPAGVGQTVTIPASSQNSPVQSPAPSSPTNKKPKKKPDDDDEEDDDEDKKPSFMDMVGQVGAVAGASGKAGEGVAKVTGLIEEFGALAAEVPVVGVVIAGLALTIGAATLGFVKFSEAMDEETRKLARFSGAAAQSTADADIKQMMAEIRRANANGDLLAQWTEATSTISASIYDVMTRIEQALLIFFLPLIKGIAWALDIIAKIANMFAPGAPDFFDDLFSNLNNAMVGSTVPMGGGM